MTLKLQRFERNFAYDAPVFCVYCGQKVVSFEDDEALLSPCKHTLFIAHDEAYEYVADRVVEQLRAKGFDVEVGDDYVEVAPPTEDDPRSSPELVTDDLEFPDGLKVASYVGPPQRVRELCWVRPGRRRVTQAGSCSSQPYEPVLSLLPTLLSLTWSPRGWRLGR